MRTAARLVGAAGTNAPAAATAAWVELEKKFPVPCDWMQQDFKPQAWEWLARPDPAVVRTMIEKAVGELREAGIAEWKTARPPESADACALLAFYARACEARRALRLRPLMAKAPRIVFAKHYNMGGSHYAYTEGQSDAQAERHFTPGAALCLLEMRGSHGDVTTLLEDPQGVIRNPDVSYDGQRILFAWKKSALEDDYHLYEMDLASRRVRQLTFGRGVADYEGVYLPDGDILFNSTRCVQTVDCFWTEVSNLYACDKDGGRLRRLTFDQVHDNFPTVTDDGRVLYTRWEYNDRGQIYPQPLYQMNPDGTGQPEFYGNNSWFPTTILHARGIPGTVKAIAIATGHHSRQAGKLILIDPARGRQEADGVQLVAPVRKTEAVRVDAYGQDGELFQYPYPLSETEYLVTYHPLGWEAQRLEGGKAKKPSQIGSLTPRFGIYFMTMDGRRELLASDPALPCNQPVPLAPRPAPRRRPSLVDYAKTEGTCYVQDVHAGPGIAGVPRGVVKTLRVVTLDFRAAGIGMNTSHGPGGAALSSTPVSIGNGCWDPKIILGDATVRADGSAFFTVPARTPVYFQLLDERGRMVQTMRSWTTLQPGENQSCVGCHEHKNSAPPASRRTLAFKAGPETLRPFYGPPRGFSFAKEIQPILDRHCVRCHDGGTLDLTAAEVLDTTAKRRWSRAYVSLTHAIQTPPGGFLPDRRDLRGNPDHPLVNWVSAQSPPPMLPPYPAGSNRSKLIEMLDRGHNDVKLSREAMDKLAAWMDLGVPFCGDYIEANAWTEEEKAKYQRYFEKRKRLEAEELQTLRAFREDGNRFYATPKKRP
ncbi:MAG: hypothetical protein N2689_03595 [Verrucomicrobiae bacterium]|nr:hypothetical protein [Verrucomicrobiae bacterium]